MAKPNKTPARLGSCRGGRVSQEEHDLLWKVVRSVKHDLERRSAGHNDGGQPLQDSLDKLEDEYEDPEPELACDYKTGGKDDES